MDVPVPRKPPTVRLRRLSGELKRLRLAAGLSQETVAERTGFDKSSMYRIERALNKPQRRTVITLLDLYGVTDEGERAELLNLLKDAGKQNWFQVYEEYLSDQYATYIGFEGEADALSNYESLFVPGLLQTEDYARAVIHGVAPALADEEVDQRVQVRMQRQRVLAQPEPVKLWVIVDEAVIRRQVGGEEVTRIQMQHLVDAAKAPTITLQVVPFGAGAHPGMPGSFVVMEFPDPSDPALVYTDSMAGDLFLEKDSDVQRYRSTFQQLAAQALSPAETAKILRSAAKAA
jgi:transcriptional regulator with XRE-family HTH domain